MSYETILLDTAQNVATITLNRPDALNGLTIRMTEELVDALIRCRADTNVRAVIVKGAGRGFCAGGDVKAFGESLRSDPLTHIRTLAMHLHASVAEIRRMEKPVIAQVHGAAAGAGMSLALACDLTIASETAQFSIAYVKVGLSPDGSATYFLPRLVGPKKALEIFYTGDLIDAGEALRLGLVNRVVPDAEMEKETQALAQQLAQGPTLALARAKELVYRSLSESLETQLENERELLGLRTLSDDFREGVQAFIDKRQPKFRGR
jgi:2-(1,2-epoxy-1,2-dihydrophenyl)acetyl-CoA isomerase